MATPHISILFLNIPLTLRELLDMQAGLELFAARRNSADCVVRVGGGTKGKLRRSTLFFGGGRGSVQCWGMSEG